MDALPITIPQHFRMNNLQNANYICDQHKCNSIEKTNIKEIDKIHELTTFDLKTYKNKFNEKP